MTSAAASHCWLLPSSCIFQPNLRLGFLHTAFKSAPPHPKIVLMSLHTSIWEFTFLSRKGYRVDVGLSLKPAKMILKSNSAVQHYFCLPHITATFPAVSQEWLLKLKMSYLAFIQLPPSPLPKQSSKLNSPRKASKIKRGQK